MVTPALVVHKTFSSMPYGGAGGGHILILISGAFIDKALGPPP